MSDIIRDPVGNRLTTYGGQMIEDSQGNVWVLTLHSDVIHLAKYTPHGSKEVFSPGRQVFALEFQTSPYVTRRRPATMAIDKNDVIHLAWHQWTRLAGYSNLIDINYMRFKDGEILSEKIITTQWGTFHFPQITIDEDSVYIAWETVVPPRENRLYYSVMTLQGEPVVERVPFSWGLDLALNPILFGDGGELTAFWWENGSTVGGPRPNSPLMAKSTHNPPPPSIINRLGINHQDDLGSKILKLTWLLALAIFNTALALINNIYIIVSIPVFLLLLSRIGILEQLYAKPMPLLICILAMSTLVLTPPSSSLIIFGQHYYLFASFASTLFLILLIKIKRIQIGNNLTIILCSLGWLLINLMVQIIPTIPYQHFY